MIIKRCNRCKNDWIITPNSYIRTILFPSLVFSEDNIYEKHNISFQIPVNWSVTKDVQSSNDTQIVLSDRTSTIRIDIVDLPQMTWLMNSSSNEFAINSVVLGYYQTNILKQDSRNINAWSSANNPQPDGIRQLTFGVGGEGQEWVLGWSKPEYGEKFISVHALFDGNFTVVDLSEGRSDWRYYMPIPFYDLLDSFKTNFGTKVKKTYGLPVQKMVFKAKPSPYLTDKNLRGRGLPP